MPEQRPDWQEKILAQIDARQSTIFLADDPDGLLLEESLQQALQAKGCELHFYEDSLLLRYYLEHKFEHMFETGGDTISSPGAKGQTGAKACVVSVDSNRFAVEATPYDIKQRATRLSLSLADCFPQLSYGVLESLQPEELNLLDAALVEYTPGNLNESASSDFVLRHVYKIAPEIIQTSSDLLRALLRLHYRDIELPAILKRRLVNLLGKRLQFANWPLKAIVEERQQFFGFLQQHWPGYVRAVLLSLPKGIKEPHPVYEVDQKAGERVVLPFGHDDVRVYIDNLFLEGFLNPIEIDDVTLLDGHWCLVGIRLDPVREQQKRFDGLLRLCTETLPDSGDRHQNWQQFAYRWAELSALYHVGGPKSPLYLELRNCVDQAFSAWLLAKYASLHNHPPVPPAMLHHIPRVMARYLEGASNRKAALILIDGLAIDQWVTLKQKLPDLALNESSVFAWIPTVTSVSRQALFSAKAPYQFAKTIGGTSAEPKAWQQFWLDQGLEKNQVFYEKGLGTNDDVETLLDRLSDRRLRAVGLVINTVDDMMHGMLLGAKGMHNQVALWGESGYLKRLVSNLVEKGFSIHITSDHGNVEATGSGKINEGAIAESRGERVRVYETETLRNSVNFPSKESLDWPQAGLPNGYWPKVMTGREAYVAEGERIVGHGGIAIEEVIVPYITIDREVDE